MRRSNLNEGTRAEILAELDQLGQDATSEDKMRELKAAIDEIEDGTTWVRVRHAVYWVIEDDVSPDRGEKDARAAG